MKILISDYAELMNDTSQREKRYLLEQHPDWEVEIYPYTNDTEELLQKLTGVDVLLTSFLPLNKEIIEKMYTIKCISIDATGYSAIDVEAATKKKIAVLAIDEYCTLEVAEHTMGLILTLSRGMKRYQTQLEENYQWNYETGGNLRRISGQKIGIFGYGRIGRQVAKLCKSFGMEVYVYQDNVHLMKEEEGVHLANLEEICKNCSIITNHMSQTKENYHFFNQEFFNQLEKTPIFVNVGRGEAVEEEALIEALDKGILAGAALDVLNKENPDLKNNKLLKRDNVIITPHAAFYSMESIEALARIATDNIIFYMNKEHDKVRKIINPDVCK